jgi:hypothetical protein
MKNGSTTTHAERLLPRLFPLLSLFAVGCGGPIECPEGATCILVDGSPQALSIADVNGDFPLDLAVSTADEGVALMFAARDRPFGAPIHLPLGEGAGLAVMGDIDADSRPDFAAPRPQSGVVSVIFNEGEGDFSLPVDFAIGSGARSIALGDLDGDALFDIIALTDMGEVRVLFNNQQDDSFSEPYVLELGDNFEAMDPVDLNLDGFLDLVVSGGAGGMGDVGVLYGVTDDAFEEPVRISIGRSAGRAITQFLNIDGNADIIVLNPEEDTVSVLFGNGDRTFSEPSAYETGGRPVSVVAKDVSSDFMIDLVIASAASDEVTVLLNDGEGHFGEAIRCPVGASPTAVAVEDFNFDGQPDLVVTTERHVMLLPDCLPRAPGF